MRVCPFVMLAAWMLLGGAVQAEREVCIYTTETGSIAQVRSRTEVPAARRNSMRCFNEKVSQQQQLAAPREIALEGNVGSDTVLTEVGKVSIRWPRSVERLFGRTPRRAVSEAAQAASRALKRPGFPSVISNLNLSWEVVFMDEELPESQIPWYLVTNCHPAWMTPPSNMYFVAQRVVAGCGGGRRQQGAIADATLAEILLHEMGHVIEHHLLGGQQHGDRMMAEGFASWFEQFAAEFSPLIPKGSVQRAQRELAARSLQSGEQLFAFQGSAADYSRASLLFQAIEERRGVAGVMRVYEQLKDGSHSFASAVKSELGWSQQRWADEVMKLLS